MQVLEDQFVRKRAEAWRTLEGLLVGRGSRAGFEGVRALDALYNACSADLSYARTHFPQSETCRYLNSLVSKAHGRYYAAKRGGMKEIGAFFTRTLPALLVKNLPYTLAALGLMLAAGVFSYIMVTLDQSNAGAFMPQDMVDRLGVGGGTWDSPVVSSEIMVNNLQVAVLGFALGVTLGIGTVYVLVVNGFVLGTVSAVILAQAPADLYWSYILPHGVFELAAIFIACGAGLRIGMSLLRPGRFRRADSLMFAGRESAMLLGAVVPLLIVAAVIEGFFTPSDASPAVKLGFAALTGALMLAYYFWGVISASRAGVRSPRGSYRARDGKSRPYTR